MTPTGALKSKETFWRTVIAPVSLLVAGLILAVIAAAIWIAHRQTADILERERNLAESALAARRSVLEKTTDDYAYWDEAFAHAGERDDAAWVDANVAKPVAEKYGFRIVAVVDGAGRAVFGARDDVRFSGPLAQVLAGGVETLLGEVTGLDRKDGAAGVLMLGDTPALAAISRIRPFASGTPAGPAPDRFLVFVDALDPPQLAALAKAYLLPALRVAETVSGDAAIAIESVDGTRRAALVWRGSDPGDELLKSILPILLALLIVFAGLIAYVLAQGRAASVRLRESERRASTDPLTGLANRLALFARAEELMSVAHASGFALAYLDLDGFKQVNDEHGHGAGDEVLKQAGRRMASAIREGDLLARLGGDEFAVLLPDTVDPAVVRQVAGRLIRAIEEPFAVNGAAPRIGVTIGVAVAPADARDALDLVKAADAALYRAKRLSKGTVQFSLSAHGG